MLDERQLLTIGPTARFLHVTVKWLRDEALAGRVPHLKAGDRLLFDPRAVEQELLRRASAPPIEQEARP